MYEELLKEINYAKTSINVQELLHEAYGRITMAHRLGAINSKEFMGLNNQCVTNGINNFKYFRKEDK